MNDDRAATDETVLRAFRHDLLTQVHHLRGYGELIEEDVADSGPAAWLQPIRDLCALTQRLEPAIRARFSGTDPSSDDDLDNLLVSLGQSLELLAAARAEASDSLNEDLDRLLTARDNLLEMTKRGPMGSVQNG